MTLFVTFVLLFLGSNVMGLRHYIDEFGQDHNTLITLTTKEGLIQQTEDIVEINYKGGHNTLVLYVKVSISGLTSYSEPERVSYNSDMKTVTIKYDTSLKLGPRKYKVEYRGLPFTQSKNSDVNALIAVELHRHRRN